MVLAKQCLVVLMWSRERMSSILRGGREVGEQVGSDGVVVSISACAAVSVDSRTVSICRMSLERNV